MNYKPRPGVVMIQVCGVSLLIPTREIYDSCGTVQRLPLPWAITWAMLAAPRTEGIEQKIFELHRTFSKKPDEEIRRRIDAFCEDLCAKGFLVRTEEPSAPAGTDAHIGPSCSAGAASPAGAGSPGPSYSAGAASPAGAGSPGPSSPAGAASPAGADAHIGPSAPEDQP